VPTDYHRDDAQHLITATFSEPFTMDDFLAVVERQAAEETWHYALLYDLRAMHLRRTAGDGLQHFIDRVQTLGAGRQRGPVGAIINPLPELVRSTLATAELTAGRLNFEFFFSTSQLEEWLTRIGRR